MAEGKSKTGVVKKRASKREKKDWIVLINPDRSSSELQD